MKIETIKDGEIMDFPKAGCYEIICCDCGLVHKFVFNRPVRVMVIRDDDRTAEIRKEMKIAKQPNRKCRR